jgi:hypothetical protein
MVGAAGLEPATLCLEGRCSIHLSYAPDFPIQELVLTIYLPWPFPQVSPVEHLASIA